jgi:F420-non-reducing hydrogenase iron-sulfur subunit
MCSSRVDAQHILKAFQEGIDGVLVGGCHFGDCHYISGNHLTYKRIGMLKRILPAFGIEPERLRLEWISAAEGRKLADVNDAFIEEIRALGPVSLRAGM